MAESPSAAPTDDTAGQLAALDLGSNSFHLIVAQHHNGRLQVLDRLKEMVRLAAGLDTDNQLTASASERALQCLERFGQRLRELPAGKVRVVGTNTLRKARNRQDFLADAEARLGHKIDIISGREEARLIYLGVSHALEDHHDQRLVIDIGGGSTELIVGQQFEPRLMESLHMGCVSMSARHFSDGRITPARLNSAELSARQEFEPIQNRYRRTGWGTAIGASGSILAINEVIGGQRWSADGVTHAALERLKAALVEAGHVDNLKLPGLDSERAPVFPGGVAILAAAFRALSIETLQVSQGALREGLLHDLLGRVQRHDVREASIEDLARRYHVDVSHARRVHDTAMLLYRHAAPSWSLQADQYQKLLRWACAIHEIGMDIAHSQYHKHGDYLVQNMDLAGFSHADQQRLAFLVRTHRRKYPPEDPDYATLSDAPSMIRLSVLLRLAVTLHRNRTPEPLPDVNITVGATRITLRPPLDWLNAHPLTALDLEQEADYLDSLSLKLRVKPR